MSNESYRGHRPKSRKGKVRKTYDQQGRKAALRKASALKLSPDTGPRSIASWERDTAKLFMHGRSQAVRLPLAFRMPGDRVRVRRVEGGILLQPIATDIDAVFSEIDRRRDPSFMAGGREQPALPDDAPDFD